MNADPKIRRALPHAERRIVLLYALVGSVWILASDQILERLAIGNSDPLRLQTIKGLDFILITSVLLYLVLTKSYNRWRSAEDKLRDTQERVACAARAVTDAVWDWDPRNDSVWWSDGFYNLFGYERADVQLTLQYWSNLVHPDDRERVNASLRRAFERGDEKWSEEYRFRRKDGTYSMVQDKGYAMYDALRKPCRMVGGMTDITERKQAEAKLEVSRRQLRALSGRVELLREQEQSRIAREIHDELGQMLTGLKMDLRWMENRLSERPDSTLNLVLEKMVEATELVDSTIASVQKISAELRPRLLDTLGICAATRSEASRLQERTGMSVRVDCPEDLPGLSEQVSTATFRICQEALTNVVRHAGATEVNIRIQREEQGLWMQISDNGKGINLSALGAPDSLGLLGMQERASLLGGETTIAPGNPVGTVVTVRLPAPAEPSKPPAP